MAKACSVCSHPKRALIDRKLLARASHRTVATQFRLAKASISRHVLNHLSRDVAKIEAGRPARIGREFDALLNDNHTLSRMARKAGNVAAAVMANRECRALLELQLKLSGVGERAQTTNVSVSVIDPATALRIAQVYVERHGGGNKLLEGKL